jgi:hypothetical protein
MARSDAEVAGDSKLGASSDGEPVQCRDHGQRKRANALERATRTLEQLARALLVANAGEFAQITAGGERFVARSGQNRGLQRRIRSVRPEDLGDLREHGRAQRVAFFGAVDAHAQHRVARGNGEVGRSVRHVITFGYFASHAAEPNSQAPLACRIILGSHGRGDK